ncbi:MAG: hypothetical protein LUG54_11470 [Clostridiales bacterium]|nr:hypothetical protein [Clostridiales bacterium]
MQNLVKKYVEKFVHEKAARRKAACVTLALALAVTAGVYWQFKLTGAALANDYNCGREEHTHTDECYEDVLICGLDGEEGHVHTDDCYEKQPVCGLTEHTHTAECLSDSTADVETASDWEDTVPSQTGVWSELVVAAAQSQIGYQESTLNYILADDGETKNGYTRYGEWAGNPYGDWDAMFVSFCLYYAGVSTEKFPESTGAYAWSVNLQDMDLYADAAEYTPVAGDLVFFDTDEDGKIDRVGIIAELMAADAEDDASDKDVISVIEGNYEDAVCLNEYAINDETILGYGMLPEGETAVPVVERETTLTYEGSDYSVTVTYNWEAGLPDGTELAVSEYEQDSETWLSRYAEAADLYSWEEDSAPEFRLFNISLTVDGEETEPTGDVEVTISCFENGEDAEYTDYTVTHYGEDETESVDFETECEDGVQTFSFCTDGFSDYGVSLASEEGTTVTATYTITRGDTVVIPGSYSGSSVEGLTILPAYQVCTEITSGGSYLIANYQSTTAVFLTDTATTSGSTNALALVSDTGAELLTQDDETYLVSDVAGDATLWTFTGADGAYTIAGDSGYININYYNVTLVTENPRTLSVPLIDNALYYTIGYNGYYLDRYSTSAAAGWYDGASNANERWYLLQENGTSVTGTTPGTYTVTTEDGTYTIVVEDYATVDGVSPSGTLIHLFDYWLTDQEAADNSWSSEYLESGINAKHALKFSKAYPNGAYNCWTGTANVYQNIVQNQLSDGYPLLNSLTYTSTAFSVINSTESLAYLFDPTYTQDGKASYTKVQNLLQVDDEGYYYYDSKKNYAEYDEDTNSFILYDDWAVNQGSTMEGQFFRSTAILR